MSCFFDLWTAATNLKALVIVGALLLLLAAITLFRMASTVKAQSGRQAMVDVFASVWGVSVLTLISLFRGQRGKPVLFLTLCILCGIVSAAVFRRVSQ